MANGLPIDIETFRNLKSPEAKMDALFDVLVYMNASGYECATERKTRLEICDTRITKLENRKKFDTGVSGGMGLFGGALAWLTQKLLGG